MRKGALTETNIFGLSLLDFLPSLLVCYESIHYSFNTHLDK
jgi:hypothetical protein